MKTLFLSHKHFGRRIGYRVWHKGPVYTFGIMGLFGKIRFIWLCLRGWKLDDWTPEGVTFVKGEDLPQLEG